MLESRTNEYMGSVFHGAGFVWSRVQVMEYGRQNIGSTGTQLDKGVTRHKS